MTKACRYAVLAAVAALLLESFLRWGIELGNPPLSITHPRYEYGFKPNQNVRRFGNRIAINQWGMRSPPMSATPAVGARRILVFGDSVVFGGAQRDQSEIATSVLLAHLSAGDPEVEVGNVSAGSWGTGNWRGWAEVHGFLGATDVLLVISTHDARDVPTFEPLNPNTHPTVAPFTAIGELFFRYLSASRILYQLRSWKVLPAVTKPQSTEPVTSKITAGGDLQLQRGLADLRAFLVEAQRSGARVSVLQFWERAEMIAGTPFTDHAAIKTIVEDLGIPCFQVEPVFRNCSSAPAEELYVDAIHPYTVKGQACLATAMRFALIEPRNSNP